MIGVTELRSGTIFEDQGQTYQVLAYEHIKMGRGSANVKVKVKNIKTGSTTDKSFISNARVNNLQIIKKDVQYLYRDDDGVYFMNPQTFDQITVPLKILDGVAYLKEGETFSLSFLGNEAIALNLPPKMEFTIVDTGPSLRGNSATNIYKDAVLDNGIKTKVPLFININDVVRIDTRTGAYSEKA